jgi:SAM-dependent methyltransferase
MDKAELKRYTESNRAAWNEVMPYHQHAAREKWDRLFAQPGYVCLPEVEIELLRQNGLKGKSVVHLCCNNGVELLSLKNLGAAQCTGFDISDAAIEEATKRAQHCGIDCRFVRTDVYEIGAEYHNHFDLAYMTAGCFGWMPDLPHFFAKAAALLRENGLIFIHEIHPLAELLSYASEDALEILRIVEPYFRTEPYVEVGALDYVGYAKYPSSTTQYWFVHTISDIMMGLVGNGFAIEYFAEYESAISPNHKSIEATKAGIPLSYILIGRKSPIEQANIYV